MFCRPLKNLVTLGKQNMTSYVSVMRSISSAGNHFYFWCFKFWWKSEFTQEWTFKSGQKKHLQPILFHWSFSIPSEIIRKISTNLLLNFAYKWFHWACSLNLPHIWDWIEQKIWNLVSITITRSITAHS